MRDAKRPRPGPTCEFAPCDNAAVRHKPIVLRTGRGDSRVTPDEARRLRDALDAAYHAALAAEAEADAAAAKRANVPTEPAGLFAGLS